VAHAFFTQSCRDHQQNRGRYPKLVEQGFAGGYPGQGTGLDGHCDRSPKQGCAQYHGVAQEHLVRRQADGFVEGGHDAAKSNKHSNHLDSGQSFGFYKKVGAQGHHKR